MEFPDQVLNWCHSAPQGDVWHLVWKACEVFRWWWQILHSEGSSLGSRPASTTCRLCYYGPAPKALCRVRKKKSLFWPILLVTCNKQACLAYWVVNIHVNYSSGYGQYFNPCSLGICLKERIKLSANDLSLSLISEFPTGFLLPRLSGAKP